MPSAQSRTTTLFKSSSRSPGPQSPALTSTRRKKRQRPRGRVAGERRERAWPRPPAARGAARKKHPTQGAANSHIHTAARSRRYGRPRRREGGTATNSPENGSAALWRCRLFVPNFRLHYGARAYLHAGWNAAPARSGRPRWGVWAQGWAVARGAHVVGASLSLSPLSSPSRPDPREAAPPSI